MRIDNLTLVRYGHFTDRTLEYSHSNLSAPDLHIVYGQNEAGKSTVSNAIMDLLFGMPRFTKYGFLHEAKNLEISAQLSTQEKTSKFTRLKTKLLDANGNSVANNSIDTHNLTAETYRSRFWFNDNVLHEGGESILNNKGELGAALFSATTGLNTLSEQLNTLMQPSNKFYMPGRKANIRVHELKKNLKTLQQEIKQLSTSKSHWNKLHKQLADHENLVSKAQETLKTTRLNRNNLTRLRNAISRYQKWAHLNSAILTMTDIDICPNDWPGLFNKLTNERNVSNKSLTRISAEIDTLKEYSNPDKKYLNWPSNKIELQHLRQSSELYIQQQELSLKLERSVESLENELLTSARTLGLHSKNDSVCDNVPLDTSIPTLDTLVDQWKTCNTNLLRIEQDINRLESKQAVDASAENDLSTQNIDRNSLELLQHAIASGESEHMVESLKQENILLRQSKTQTDTLYRAVTSIQVNAKTDLNRLVLPSSSALMQASRLRQDAKEKVARLTKAEADAQHELYELDKKISQLNTLVDHSTKELLDAREAVNKTWGLTRDAIHGKNNEADLKNLADALDNDLSNLDLKIKVRLTRADEAGEHNILQQAKHDSNTAILEISKTKALAERELENLLQEQSSMFSFSSSLSMDDFDALTEWCDNFNQWRSAENKTLSLVDSTNTLMQECDTQQCKLISLIRAAKRDTHPLEIDQNSSLAETLLYVKSEASKLEAMLLKAESSFTAKNALVEEISRLHHDQKHQQALTLDIENKIKQQVNGSWLVSENTAHVINNWSAIKLFSDQQSKLVQLKSELTQVCSALNSTDQQVIRLCKLLNIDTSTDKLANLQLLVDKYDSYIKYEATQSNNIRRLDELNVSAKQCQTEIADIDAQLAPMHKAFNTESIEQLSVSLQASDEKRNVIEQQQLIEKDVNELLEVSAFEVAEAKIEELLQLFNLCDTEEVENASAEKTAINLVNRSKLDEKLAEFDIEESEHEQSLASEQAELRSLKKQIDAMQLDEKISTLRQQEADIINEMEAGIVDTLKLRLGLHAITRGLQHFREKNQSSMLEAAKESFTRLTCGNYINLVTRPNDKGIEQLIATEQSGQSKSADGLSQGTRGQLYLALRIAAYHEYKQHRTPLPFIADDIFETFDEHRTSAALAEFSAMAEHGQVIYFTHHQHVVSLAKEMLPSINTISLN